ncbi:MAG: membrane protein insertase YidC [Pseudomonadota bacterium]
MNEQRNLLLAFVLSGVILLVWYLFFLPPPQADLDPAVSVSSQNPASATDAAALLQSQEQAQGGADQPTNPANPASGTVQTAQTPAPRLSIDNAQVHGSMSARGLRLEDLVLAAYRETTSPSSDPIRLLAPQGDLNPYFVDFGWVSRDESITVPGPQALWEALNNPAGLRPGVPVTWQWQGEGALYQARIVLDEHYLFTVDLSVQNQGTRPISLTPYGRISRYRTPDTLGYFILHEGPYGVFDDTLTEYSYDDLQDEPISQTSTGGWLGFTDKYWLVALAAAQTIETKNQFIHREDATYTDRYLALLQTNAPLDVAPGDRQSVTLKVFAGAKQVALINTYAELMTGFDRAIDFGWFFFLTKPFFYALDWLNKLVGNFGLAILIFTVAIKLVLFPLANKSYRSMSKMKLLQPQILELRERFGQDRAKLNQEMMALYKREKANPVSGCLPIVLQIPVFFALYKVLFVTIEMRHAPFFGWIQDLSAPDPTTLFNAFGLIPWTPPTFLMIGVWPILMGASMFIQQKLNPPPADPIQQKIFTFLPIFFTFLLASFPAGLVIYWTWNNLLSIAQQMVIMRQVQAMTVTAPAPASQVSDAPPTKKTRKTRKAEQDAQGVQDEKKEKMTKAEKKAQKKQSKKPRKRR